MRISFSRAFLFCILIFQGCETPATAPIGSSGFDYLPYLQTMNKIRVQYIGQTLLHYYTKQGTRDSGTDLDWWLVRQFEFQNTDTTYTLEWQDSLFTTRCCFAMQEVDVPYTFESGCSSSSLIRGVYNSTTKTVSNLLCMFQSLMGGTDPNNYQAQNASLQTAPLDFETASDDSVSFTIRNWSAGAVRPAYNDDELWTGTYIKKIQLLAFDTLARAYPPLCRIVFSK